MCLVNIWSILLPFQCSMDEAYSLLNYRNALWVFDRYFSTDAMGIPLNIHVNNYAFWSVFSGFFFGGGGGEPYISHFILHFGECVFQ